MKQLITLFSALVIVLSLSACSQETKISFVDADTENPVAQTEQKTSETVTSVDKENIFETTENETVTVPMSVHPIIPEETIVDTFVITKVSGTYVELRKIIGEDTEKLVYSCDLGNFDGSDYMKCKVGDNITLRYDKEIAETYPLQLTVREIL